jgi:regulator of replication initiation timing
MGRYSKRALYKQMKEFKNISKKELFEEYNKLREMFGQAVDKLTTTGIKLCDVAIKERKLRIENEELKEKLNKYEKANT